MKIIYIYTLSHPITGEIRYVGKTNNISKRFTVHTTRGDKVKNHCANWIKSLKRQKLLPVIEILDTVDESNWILMEQYWISQMKSWGFNLTNLTIGGEGNSGRVAPHTQTKEWSEYVSMLHKGKIVSQETKEKIRIIRTGSKNSEQSKIRNSKTLRFQREEESQLLIHVFYKSTKEFYGTFRTGISLARQLVCNPACVLQVMSNPKRHKSVKGLIIHRINCIS